MERPNQPPRILILGAHPDDADLKAGGCASKWRRLGCEVKLVSVTDGRSGHQTQHGPALAQRRRAEALAAGAVIGATYDLLDHPDRRLRPTAEAPSGVAAARSWLHERIRRRLRPLADGFRDVLVHTYGEVHGRRVEYMEGFEASEYGAPFDAAARARLFPFVPGAAEVAEEQQ